MKRIQHSEIGDPAAVLKVVDVDVPSPGAGQVRVKVLATPIHPSNLLKVAGLYGVKPELPDNPGTEGVGEVVELGEGVDSLAVGQRVLLTAGVPTWTTQLVAPAAGLVPVPNEADPEQLSMLVINPMTAYLMLHTVAELKAGDWVVQSAANSAVGEYLIQLAKIAGFRTVNVVRRENVTDRLKALGADAVVVAGEELPKRIHQATGGEPTRLAIDAVAGDTLGALLASLGEGGTAVSYGAMSMQPAPVQPGSMIFNDLTLRGFWLSKWFKTASPADRQRAFGAMIPLVAGGQVKTQIDARFPLEQITEAVTRAAEAGRSGKVLLVPDHG